jgi:hypothetical protein
MWFPQHSHRFQASIRGAIRKTKHKVVGMSDKRTRPWQAPVLMDFDADQSAGFGHLGTMFTGPETSNDPDMKYTLATESSGLVTTAAGVMDGYRGPGIASS